MKTRPRLVNRRSFLAGASATVLLPSILRAQDGSLKLQCRFDDQTVTYTLFDNPTVRDLVSMLPLELTIEDFSNNEKIAHLPRRLDEGGLAPFSDETPGDLCYFLGWGNLAFFYADYQFRNDLIRLGHIDGPLDPLTHRGTYPLRVALTD
ncbi:cyclophilin-like fold protein [uncultured Martelella sp.]|uniref:cyclophilin-like fold protein n=1 Tax=uncultured Martelella sp. TaxID=392331 RepID=UPI0029C8FE37|nr:cyclophilin-like fold protein [uncultured Martelella sp.]